MTLKTPKPTRKERAEMTHDELLRAVWLLDEVIESFTWIPISKRLPEHDGPYLACLDDGYITTIMYATDCDGTQDWELLADSGEVVAWMHLPEPYHPEN